MEWGGALTRRARVSLATRLSSSSLINTPDECRGRRQIAYDDTVTTKPKIRTSLRGMVVDERGCTPPARDVATGTFHQLIYQLHSSSSWGSHPAGARFARDAFVQLLTQLAQRALAAVLHVAQLLLQTAL
jgi:hypothetical protein